MVFHCTFNQTRTRRTSSLFSSSKPVRKQSNDIVVTWHTVHSIWNTSLDWHWLFVWTLGRKTRIHTLDGTPVPITLSHFCCVNPHMQINPFINVNIFVWFCQCFMWSCSSNQSLITTSFHGTVTRVPWVPILTLIRYQTTSKWNVWLETNGIWLNVLVLFNGAVGKEPQRQTSCKGSLVLSILGNQSGTGPLEEQHSYSFLVLDVLLILFCSAVWEKRHGQKYKLRLSTLKGFRVWALLMLLCRTLQQWN